MRTIKFRGKCTDDGMWRYGDLLHDNGLLWINDNGLHCTVDPNTVGQFTGLKDKNENEIHEGDSVKCNEFVYKVVFNDKRFASFGLRRKADMFMHYFGEAMESQQCEVIGNIYDNPELITD